MKDVSERPGWMYDESRHCGVDYAKAEQANAYDERHTSFRDVKREFSEMLALLDAAAPGEMAVLDIGCGTGLFTEAMAETFAHVHAVDVSLPMLEQARAKRGRGNVTFHQAGFLTYVHEDKPVDLIVTKMAFHHLPDFWKQVALLRMNGMLKLGGWLYIHDVVFGFAPEEYFGRVGKWVETIGYLAGERVREETETHIRDEYSTFGWILEGMLVRAGFSMEKNVSADGLVTHMVSRKVRDV